MSQVNTKEQKDLTPQDLLDKIEQASRLGDKVGERRWIKLLENRIEELLRAE